jgi:hypothetical protein
MNHSGKVNLFPWLSTVQIRRIGEVEIMTYAFLTTLYTRRKTLCVQWMGGWVGPKYDLYVVRRRKILPLSGSQSNAQPVASLTEPYQFAT